MGSEFCPQISLLIFYFSNKIITNLGLPKRLLIYEIKKQNERIPF